MKTTLLALFAAFALGPCSVLDAQAVPPPLVGTTTVLTDTNVTGYGSGQRGQIIYVTYQYKVYDAYGTFLYSYTITTQWILPGAVAVVEA